MRRSTSLFAALLLLAASVPALGQTAKDIPVKEWLVTGTFPVKEGPTRVTFNYLGDEAGADGTGPQWIHAPADTMGRVNLLRVFTTQKENAAAYAFVYIISPTERTINLGYETDDDGMAWLNGALVHHKEVARGVRETDTLTLRLSRGVNRLLYKVVNRSGGFGVGGRLLANSPDPITDLVTTTTKPAQPLATAPAPYVTIGEPHLSARAVLDSTGALTIPLFVNVTRWGNSDQPVTIAFAGARVAAPKGEGSLPTPIELRVSWNDVVAAVKRGDTRVAAQWSKQRAQSTTAVRATEMLGVFSKPILVDFHWQDKRVGDWSIQVPPALAGLELALDVAEFVPGSTIELNGASTNVDARQQLLLCSPCQAGAPVRVHIDTNGSEWWDSPRLLVRSTGFSDVVQSARLARIITGDSGIAMPADSVARRVLLLMADKDKTAYLHAIDAMVQKQAAVTAMLRRDTIDLIGNSHIDAAWLWRWPETVEVVRNTWRTAVKLLDKYPEMKFAASAAQYYVWLEQYEPELLTKIQQLVKEGRWIIVGGMWVESDVNMPTGESLAMQELLGQRTFMRLFGKYATVAWIPDTFGYPWQLPQVFSQAGLQGFITQKLRWNDTNEWTADHNYFIWQGRDGTQLPTYIPFGYDHDLDADRLAREFRAQADSAATRRLLTLYGVGDHGGGPTMQMLDRAEEAKRAPAFPVLRDVDPAASMQAMARDLNKAPKINDELYFEYHRGVQTTQAANKQWNRRMEGLLLATDAAAAVAPAEYPRQALEAAWRKTLFNQFHDILPGSGIGPIYADAKADYAVADSIARAALDAALHAMADKLDTRAPKQAQQAYFVFNPTGYTRSGYVKLPDSTTVFAANIPPVGGTVVFVAKQPAVTRTLAGTVLENDSLRLEIDPATGNIARLFDKRLKRELLAPGAQGNMLMLQPDNPRDWDAWNIDSVNGPWTPVADSVKIGTIEDDGNALSITVERAGKGIHAKQRYVLPKNAVRVDIENTIDWHTEHQLLKAFFPLAPRADSVWAEIAFGAIGRPAIPTSRKDSARFELPMHRWIDASESDWGVSLVNDAKYGYSVHGDTLRLSLLRAPKWPDPNADMGTHHFRYSIVPHRGTWRSGATMQAADELNRPMRAIAVEQHPGVGRTTSALRVEGDGIELSAVKRAEAGENLIVRLVERNGSAGSAAVILPAAVQWRETNLIEVPQGEWQNSDGRIVLPMRPWQIRTIEVKR